MARKNKKESSKKSPEQAVEDLVKEVSQVFRGKNLNFKQTIVLEITGQIFPTSVGEIESDDIEVRVRNEGTLSNNVVAVIEDALAEHIRNNIFSQDSTDIPQIDDACDTLNQELNFLEEKTTKLEEALDEAGIDWPANDWIDKGYHEGLWDAIMDEAHNRANGIDPSAQPTFYQPYKNTIPTPLLVEIPSSSNSLTSDPSPSNQSPSQPIIENKPLPRYFAASPVKPQKSITPS